MDESEDGMCIVHGTNSWTADEYVQGRESYSGYGTYHLNISRGSFSGLLSWVITKYVDGEPVFTDCEVTYRLTGRL